MQFNSDGHIWLSLFCLLFKDLMAYNSILARKGMLLSLHIFWVLETCRATLKISSVAANAIKRILKESNIFL